MRLQEFWRRMDHLVELNTKLVALGKSDSPFKNLQKAPIVAAMAGEILALYNGKTIRSGSFDLMPETPRANCALRLGRIALTFTPLPCFIKTFFAAAQGCSCFDCLALCSQMLLDMDQLTLLCTTWHLLLYALYKITT